MTIFRRHVKIFHNTEDFPRCALQLLPQTCTRIRGIRVHVWGVYVYRNEARRVHVYRGYVYTFFAFVKLLIIRQLAKGGNWLYWL